MRRAIFSAILCGAASISAAPTATAYQIDCALLLCLPGGFPASEPCSRAYAEMIRRITPFPIEPPLQPWRCDFTSGGVGIPVGLGPDGLPADVRRTRDSIEIYHVQMYYHKRGGDNEYIQDITQVGRWGSDGVFRWQGASYRNGPAWLAEAAGGTVITKEITTGGCDFGEYCPGGRDKEVIRTETTNDHFGRLRGVFMRYPLWDGTYHTEAVKY